MQVSINGECKKLENGTSISALLTMLGVNITQVAVERNGEIVPKSKHTETLCADGDVIELVRFIGGG
jgi:thiamine biosynthesis protein ThiS